jgi:MscS family membrane protein
MMKKLEGLRWFFVCLFLLAAFCVPLTFGQKGVQIESVEIKADLNEAGSSTYELVNKTDSWFHENLPEWMFKKAFILENFQWVGLLVLIFIGIGLDRFLRSFLNRLGRRLFHRQSIDFDENNLLRVSKWLGVCSAGIFWRLAIEFLDLPPGLFSVFKLLTTFLAVGSGVIAAIKAVDLMGGVMEEKAKKTENKFDDILVPLARKAAKVFIAAFGFVFVADNLDINISSLLAGLGLGGLAFALAAKDTVENIFGSITVLVDRPFQIGDWINVGGVDGTVEAIGLRSTRIRTFYNSLITVPNSNLIKASVDNYGLRKYRRIRTMLSVTYNSEPKKIDAFCEGIREIIRQHPYTRKDYFHVWLNQFSNSSLDILVYCFVETPDWATELREKHRFFLDILKLSKRIGIEFAFPTQTLYMERGHGPAKPDKSPFSTFEEMIDLRGQSRKEVDELVGATLHHSSAPFPPPPVDFDLAFDSEEAYIPRRNRGGADE